MPLTQDAQMPAGHGQGQIGDPVSSTARNMSMLDEEDEEMTQARARLAAMQARKRMQGDKPMWLRAWTEAKRRVKRGPKVYVGDRIINLGNPGFATTVKYPGNSISTSKYNLITFVPKFLAGAFGEAQQRPQRRILLTRMTGQSNSRNTPTSFSFSPLAFSKSQMCHRRIDTRQSHR